MPGPACRDVVSVAGDELRFAGHRLFLNGINIAWISYAGDTNASASRGFGMATYCGWEEALRFVSRNGGNSVRVWLLNEPHESLLWDEDRVLGLRHDVIPMAQALLEAAARLDVFVVLVLFNGAFVRKVDCPLFGSAATLDSLTTKVVRPLAAALRDYNSLAMWEVINEPEGMVDPALIVPPELAPAATSCPGPSDGAGWSKDCLLPLVHVQRFINRVAAAIRSEDSWHLLTAGAWHICTTTEGAYSGEMGAGTGRGWWLGRRLG